VDVHQCHYLVDLDLETSAPREPRSSPLFRAFFIPFLSEQHTTYTRYVILKPRRPKQPRKRTHA
ncbi:unnamed protein product, partial [Coregonus sp. 'balchen']